MPSGLIVRWLRRSAGSIRSPLFPDLQESLGCLILPKGRLLPSPGRTLMVFGDLVRLDPSERIRTLGTRIEDAMAALADEVTTDWWQARRRVHTGQTPSLTGPEAASWRRARALSHRSRPRRRRWPR